MSPRTLLGWLASACLIGQVSAQVALDRPARPAPALLLATGFDFPLGAPDAAGYYKARGFSLGNHPGEDWDGVKGGESDLDDPVASIGEGEVIVAGDAHFGWGNVVIVRHQFREGDGVQTIDAFFAHLGAILVRQGQRVARGEEIGTVGTAHGRYQAHLHFEIRKNLEIGTNRAAFPCDFSCYYDPTRFIAAHRQIGPGQATGLYASARRLAPARTEDPPRPVAPAGRDFNRQPYWRAR